MWSDTLLRKAFMVNCCLLSSRKELQYHHHCVDKPTSNSNISESHKSHCRWTQGTSQQNKWVTFLTFTLTYIYRQWIFQVTKICEVCFYIRFFVVSLILAEILVGVNILLKKNVSFNWPSIQLACTSGLWPSHGWLSTGKFHGAKVKLEITNYLFHRSGFRLVQGISDHIEPEYPFNQLEILWGLYWVVIGSCKSNIHEVMTKIWKTQSW